MAVSVGAGVGVAPDYEGSDDYEAVPLPFARVTCKSGRYAELMFNRFKVNLIGSDMWRLGPVLQYRGARDDVDNKAVDNMESVDAAWELGGFAGVNIDGWKFSLQVVQDVGNGHDGMLVTLAAAHKWQLGEDWGLLLGASTTYADDDYMDTYFSVDDRDARCTGLKEYEADADLKDVGTNLVISYNPCDYSTLMLVGAYKRLLGDADDSPVVDDEGDPNQFFGGLVLTVNF
jgi:outer membrane protein